jgi:transposase
MAYNFVAVDREQLMLMPPSVADWLPEDHLAWFVLDVVAGLDLTGFLSGYRADGRGGAAYDPAMMLTVLIYGYCTGERSSRRIERRLVEDVAFRVVAANQQPDHATIARFRATHETAIASLFGQVLAVCAKQGLLRPGLVAIDGTRMVANASKERTGPLKRSPRRSSRRPPRLTRAKTPRSPIVLRGHPAPAPISDPGQVAGPGCAGCWTNSRPRPPSIPTKR